MAPRLTDDFTDLVIHVLAHVRMGGAGRSFDPRYVAWAREHMPPQEGEWLREGAAVLERAWAQDVPDAVHGWPELFGSIEALRGVATAELGQLRPVQVRDAGALVMAQRVAGAPLELLHATVCALAPWYAAWRREVVVPRLEEAVRRVEPWLAEACRLLPSLAKARVELAWALGERGRAFVRRIVVGAPAGWNELDARVPAVLAMHEQLVRESDEPGYVEHEWEALTGLAAIMVEASTPLASVHARWLASLELRPLLEGLVGAGRIGGEDYKGLVRDVGGRAGRLAAMAGR